MSPGKSIVRQGTSSLTRSGVRLRGIYSAYTAIASVSLSSIVIGFIPPEHLRHDDIRPVRIHLGQGHHRAMPEQPEPHRQEPPLHPHEHGARERHGETS